VQGIPFEGVELNCLGGPLTSLDGPPWCRNDRKADAIGRLDIIACILDLVDMPKVSGVRMQVPKCAWLPGGSEKMMHRTNQGHELRVFRSKYHVAMELLRCWNFCRLLNAKRCISPTHQLQ
jgi:hypothetical protein